MKMNKKGALVAGSLAITVGIVLLGLLLINVIGIGVLTSKLSNTPILYIVLFIGLIILITKLKK